MAHRPFPLGSVIAMIEQERRKDAPFVNRKIRPPEKPHDMWTLNAKYVFQVIRYEYKTHRRAKTEEEWKQGTYDTIQLANKAAREAYERVAERTEEDGWTMGHWDDGRVWYNCNDWGHRETVEVRIRAEEVHGAPKPANQSVAQPLEVSQVRQAIRDAKWQELAPGLRTEMKAEAWSSGRILAALIGSIKVEMKEDCNSWPRLRKQIKDRLSKDAEVQKKLLFELKQQIRDGIWKVLKDNLQERILEDEELRVELVEQAREKVKAQIREEDEDEFRETLKSEMKDELEDELREELKDELREEMRDEVRAELIEEMREQEQDELEAAVLEKLKKQMTKTKVDDLKKVAEKRVIGQWAITLSRHLQLQLSGEEGTKLREEIRKRVGAGRKEASTARTLAATAKPTGVGKKRGKRHHDRKSY